MDILYTRTGCLSTSALNSLNHKIMAYVYNYTAVEWMTLSVMERFTEER
jgi:hypothetical protein